MIFIIWILFKQYYNSVNKLNRNSTLKAKIKQLKFPKVIFYEKYHCIYLNNYLLLSCSSGEIGTTLLEACADFGAMQDKWI